MTPMENYWKKQDKKNAEKFTTQAERREDILSLKKDWEAVDWPNVPVEDRLKYLPLAVARFEYMYNNTEKCVGLNYDPKRWVRFDLKMGRTLGKLIKRSGLKPWQKQSDLDSEGYYVSRRTWGYVDIKPIHTLKDEDKNRYGGIMKPQGKGVEKKKYIRCHLFAENPMENAGDYGPAYFTTKESFFYTKGLKNGEWKSDKEMMMSTYNHLTFHDEVVA